MNEIGRCETLKLCLVSRRSRVHPILGELPNDGIFYVISQRGHGNLKVSKLLDVCERQAIGGVNERDPVVVGKGLLDERILVA